MFGITPPENNFICDTCEQTYHFDRERGCRHVAVLHKVTALAESHDDSVPVPNISCTCNPREPERLELGRALLAIALETTLQYWFPFRSPDFYETLLIALEHFRTRGLWMKKCEMKSGFATVRQQRTSPEELAQNFEFCFGLFGDGPEVSDFVITWLCKAMGNVILEAALEYERVQEVVFPPPRFENSYELLVNFESSGAPSIKDYMDMHYVGRLL